MDLGRQMDLEEADTGYEQTGSVPPFAPPRPVRPSPPSPLVLRPVRVTPPYLTMPYRPVVLPKPPVKPQMPTPPARSYAELVGPHPVSGAGPTPVPDVATPVLLKATAPVLTDRDWENLRQQAAQLGARQAQGPAPARVPAAWSVSALERAVNNVLDWLTWTRD